MGRILFFSIDIFTPFFLIYAMLQYADTVSHNSALSMLSQMGEGVKQNFKKNTAKAVFHVCMKTAFIL